MRLLRNIFLLFFSAMPLASLAQAVNFPSVWKFSMSDDSLYRRAAFDDSKWMDVSMPASWTKLGINKENTVGWYRVTFELPATMLNRDLVLFAGTIDDADETYVNGYLVGRSGKFPPNDQTAWDQERKYVIKKEWLGKKNQLAIRVYNGIGDGGITGGRVMLMLKTESDRMVAEQLKSKRSYYQLTTSNGLIAAVYNAQTATLENLYPHIFSNYDSGIAVQPVLSNLRLSKNIGPAMTSYLQHTHVIEVKYPNCSLYYFSSFTQHDKILYVMAAGSEAAIRDIDFVYETGAGKITRRNAMRNNGDRFEKYFLFGFSDTLNKMPDMDKALQQVLDAPLMQNELAYMKQVFASCHFPKGLNAAERNTLEQSIAVLKMSQVDDHEVLPFSHGQVMASLRPGVWAISWVRDASFAIEAMSRLGMYTEAKKALAFMLKSTPTDQYIHYIHTDGKDYGIGLPYVISVTRYFGNGREESDYTSNGPNIEIDDFGLFLTAFYHYVHESADSAFFMEYKEAIDKICAAIIHNINDKGVIRTESGPWEHHLPGKEFMWTSGVCARGLQLMVALYEKYHQPSQNIAAGAEKLYNGIMANCLIGKRYIKGNATEQNSNDHHYYDAATFELFANGLINDKSLFATHMAEYDKHNRALLDPAKGYIRFNSNDSYENQEWPFAGLRVAVAQKRLGNAAEAKKLTDRVTAFADRNNNLIPEILSNDMGIYKGAIPMVGYGAGAYILALIALHEK